MSALNREDRLVESLLARLPTSKETRAVHVGPGEDDCAVIKSSGSKHWQLLKTDCVIEGVHFEVDAPPEHVGWKALCRPLSDIAATGGKPKHALVTLALGERTTSDWALGVYAGLGAAAAEYKVAIVGGDTARTPGPAFLSVCVSGTVRPERCVTRGGGRPGNLLFVTGTLGGSLRSGRHLTFPPRLAESHWLTSRFRIRAMMDLSDGLAADLPRLAKASDTGYRLETCLLPLSENCNIQQALNDGEDYELLLAVAPNDAQKMQRQWQRKFPWVPLTQIGQLTESGTELGIGQVSGYDHFSRVA